MPLSRARTKIVGSFESHRFDLVYVQNINSPFDGTTCTDRGSPELGSNCQMPKSETLFILPGA